ncbi:type II secretion system F family protein, partial [Candidatus Dependentiae bacterium]|nr:type II secretion system F family protein [Candidatus Dependentiae bacterium]
MPLYQYESLNRRGVRVKGTIDASTMQVAKETLQGQGLMPISLTEVGAEGGGGFTLARLFEKPIEAKTVILFTKQLAVLLKSGVPLLQAIELLTEQFDGRFRRMLIAIKDGLKSGESFAKELARYPKVFPNVYIQLVKAGEASGKLDYILLRLTDYLAGTEETKKQIKKAVRYPIAMMGVALAVIVGMLTKMVPSMRGIFDQGGKALPGPTQFLVDCSDFMLNHYVVLSGIFFLLAVSFVYWRSTPQGKYQLDSLFLRFPPTAYFSRTKVVVQFSKTLGMLLESGVNLPEALDIVCNIVDNKVLTGKLREAQDKIIKEGKIARYLKETAIFPNIASYMISTGEQSGQLAQMLTTVGNDYDVELKEYTEALTGAITPVMTFILVGIIGFTMMAIMLPIMSMGDL